jgi:hypothetical protein
VTDMFPDPGEDWRPKLRRLLLDIDARIDSAIFQGGKWTREIYERFTAFMDHAHVAGWRRRHRRIASVAGAGDPFVPSDLR